MTKSKHLPARASERSPARGRRSRRGGFTLLELMLVVTVLSILVALAIPGYTSSRKHANETSAISSLRTFSSAQVQYRTRFGQFADLPDLTGNGFVDSSFSDGEKSGYLFVASTPPTDSTWAYAAQPVDPGVSGDRWFLVDESGVIRYRDGGAATPSDPAIQ